MGFTENFPGAHSTINATHPLERSTCCQRNASDPIHFRSWTEAFALATVDYSTGAFHVKMDPALEQIASSNVEKHESNANQS